MKGAWPEGAEATTRKDGRCAQVLLSLSLSLSRVKERALTSAGAILLLPWLCLGQGVDYEHNWAHREGGTGVDFGRGVALWHDGTVCQLSEMATGPGGDSEMKLTLSWRDSGGTLQSFSRVDGGTGAGGEIFPRDLAAGNNFMALHPSFGYYRTAFQHVVGSYMGEVSIGGKTRVSGAGGTARSAFVSQERWHIPSSQTGNHWVTSFTSTEVIEALTVASSPPRPDGFGGSALGGTSSLAAGPPDPPDDIYRPTGQANDTTVAVGGYFDGTASFPTTMSEVEFTASGSSEDAFVALVNFNNGLLLHHLTGPRYAFLQIGSPTGATRVTGIAIDPKDYTIAVTGWFEAANTNFDHHGGSFTPGSHAGGRDIFVALYEPNEYGEPEMAVRHRDPA